RNFSTTFTFISSHRKSIAWLSFTPRSCGSIFGLSWISLTLFACWCFFDSSYRYFPKSTSRHTGGVAVGAISTRSTPLDRAAVNASPSDITPNCLPSTPITRTSRARIFPFTLTKDAEEEEERGGNGRLKTPSSVCSYSCNQQTLYLQAPCLAILGSM